ncbi:response regulator [Oricola indica]|jgi:two-component system chemotaxis response regulator CheY|uniref:response regulator n=1 Tax=Oricola indica TaxID=2872591 RepID=UPI001CBCE568|nr:response regulator [Oricola indica]
MSRCLIVDGSNVVRKVAKRILASTESVVSEAESGSDGLGVFAAELPDVVMVDGNLQDMEVADFVRHVRTMHETRQPRIIVMMTEMNLALMTKAKRAGADDYLLKPFDRPQLTRCLHEFESAA